MYDSCKCAAGRHGTRVNVVIDRFTGKEYACKRMPKYASRGQKGADGKSELNEEQLAAADEAQLAHIRREIGLFDRLRSSLNVAKMETVRSCHHVSVASCCMAVDVPTHCNAMHAAASNCKRVRSTCGKSAFPSDCQLHRILHARVQCAVCNFKYQLELPRVARCAGVRGQDARLPHHGALQWSHPGADASRPRRAA